jgi:phage baseplate assembly protein W
MARVDDTRELDKPWQTRLGVSGQVIDGLDSLDQFIRVTLATQRGSVPQLLEFGINWLEILDLPVDEATPVLLRDVAAAFRKWIEPRASLVSCEPVVTNGRVTARVTWRPADSQERRTTEAAP